MPWQQVVLTVVLLAAVGWSLSEIAGRHADSRGVLRWVAVAFASLAAGNVLSAEPIVEAMDALVFPGFGRLFFNVWITGGLFALVCFFRVGRGGTGRRYRSPVVYDLFMWLAVVAALIVITVLIPPSDRHHSLTSLDYAGEVVGMFYIVGNAYFVYAYGVVAVGVAGFLLLGPVVHRIGLAILSSSLGVLCATCLVRAAWVVSPEVRAVDHGVVNEWNFAVANIATIGVCVGLCLPAFTQVVGAARLRRVRERQHRDLLPLWNRLIRAFPELCLDRAVPAPFARERGKEWKLYRRYIECRDGLTQLSPFLADVAGSNDLGDMTAEEIAALIDPALARRGAAEVPSAPRTARRVMGRGEEFEFDVDELIRVSRALTPVGG
ncbi:hypothetical protein LZ318_31995 [Saccharopolyspora indica]|uniref:MAB_1171c family putative transporter n=1 Tax=Saccharopolyspora indica TaxID=1229659 RepID=UPI0022EAE8D7|nr:MAB_1171c family putative transporter [Saccharopolyspora indica]MDA3644139.1 hypothetical protein [Saccharopolyspora indica]